MAQRGIYFSNQGLKFSYDAVEHKIFQHLLKNPKGATQTELANTLKIPRGQIIDRLIKLENKPYYYNKKTYRVIKTKFKYSILREKESTQGLNPKATQHQKNDFELKLENEVQNLSKNNILTNEIAEVINGQILFSKVNPKKKMDFKSALLKLYNEDIYDIAIGEKGVCIILKENPEDEEKMNRIKENILLLHEKTLKRQHNITRRRRIKKEK